MLIKLSFIVEKGSHETSKFSFRVRHNVKCAKFCFGLYSNNQSLGLSMDGDWTSQLVKLISLLELNKTVGCGDLSGIPPGQLLSRMRDILAKLSI